jgi:hypothetical protein
MKTPTQIADLRESIQDDIICFMDSVTPESEQDIHYLRRYIKNRLCQIVVDRINDWASKIPTAHMDETEETEQCSRT